MSKSVCIVGAGPAGLVAAKTLLHNAPPGEYKVSVFDAQGHIGGLWPASKTDTSRQIHPLMVANQSKHTVQFSDLAWEKEAPQLPRAWQVGRYLERYLDTYLASHPGFNLHLSTRLVEAKPDRQGDGWNVRLQAQGAEHVQSFQYLLVASGYFGEPIIPVGISTSPSAPVPVIHSSQYRDLETLFRNSRSAKGTILVIGGQMSGVEISSTIATHLSSASNSPEPFPIAGIEQCSVHHLVQGPMWVLPLYTSPEPKAAAAPFLPLDFPAYNLSNRPPPLVNTSGHIDESAAQTLHGIFEASLGSDQSAFSPLLRISDDVKTKPPYLAASDWYCDFVRSGLIRLKNGKFASLEGQVATLVDGSGIDNVVAVILATGFDPSPCLSYLPEDTLQKLHHSPRHSRQPLALAFHGTHHPDVPNLGFVGFYRSPYWGVMQMQARFLAEYWSSNGLSQPMLQKLGEDGSIQRTLGLRDDPRVAQFPMGDYPFLMQEFAEALSIPRFDPPLDLVPSLSHNKLPLDVLTPSRYPAPSDDPYAREQAEKSGRDTIHVAIDGLTTPRFVPRAVFRSLLGTWKLERDLTSRLPSHPSGHFSGTAKFLLRDGMTDGLQCAKQGANERTEPDVSLEYLYIEDGEFKTDQGYGFRATRRYIWRFDEQRECLSVWFVKPDELKCADYLFHEIEFLQPSDGLDKGWMAKAGHLCVEDYYNVRYSFVFDAVNLKDWHIEYTVHGPKKDYTIRGIYTR